MSVKIKIFDDQNIDQLDWPDTHEGRFTKKMLLPIIKNGVPFYFDNVKTKMMVLQVDGLVLPITINDKVLENSYVCSFYSYYIGYGLKTASAIKNGILRNIVKTILRGLGTFLKIGKIDKIVSVNNWLFSTNLYPSLTPEQILAIRDKIQEDFPKHAIVFRSINTLDQNSPINSLKHHAFDLIASRQIFITDPKKEEIFTTRLFKSDLKFLNGTTYALGDLGVDPNEGISKLLSLYNALYVDKYSAMNPKLNETFLKLAVNDKLFNFKTFKKDGIIDGIFGYYSMYGVMTSPFFGYDTNKPQEVGLYRLLSTALTLEAKSCGHLFHQSSGASFYKSIRKATPSIEYNAVYTKHLNLHRRFYWKTLKFLINSFGIPWMKKY